MTYHALQLQAAGYAPCGIVTSFPPTPAVIESAASLLQVPPERLAAFNMGEMWQIWMKPGEAVPQSEATTVSIVKRLRQRLRRERIESEARIAAAERKRVTPPPDFFSKFFNPRCQMRIIDGDDVYYASEPASCRIKHEEAFVKANYRTCTVDGVRFERREA